MLQLGPLLVWKYICIKKVFNSREEGKIFTMNLHRNRNGWLLNPPGLNGSY